jgi:hypothetical protein
MKKSSKTTTPLRASRKDEKIMPDTKEQGWGQTTGIRTQVTVTEVDGVKTITRTGI